jgi:hypothetical protein
MISPWKVSTIALAAALGAVVSTGAIPSASAEQVNMRSAVSKLQDAKAALERAADDKGGHRSRSIALVSQAITEAQAGAEYANHH